MTWSEIKRAVKKAGVSDNDEILAIRCEMRDGNGKLQVVPQGEFVGLAEGVSDEAREDASGSGC